MANWNSLVFYLDIYSFNLLKVFLTVLNFVKRLKNEGRYPNRDSEPVQKSSKKWRLIKNDQNLTLVNSIIFKGL